MISKLADPDVLGAEKVAINDIIFDELTIVDWEAKKNGEESIPFTFSYWTFLDEIPIVSKNVWNDIKKLF